MARIIEIKDHNSVKTYYPNSFHVNVKSGKIGKLFKKKQVWIVEVRSCESFGFEKCKQYYFNKQKSAEKLQKHILSKLIGRYPELDITSYIEELFKEDSE